MGVGKSGIEFAEDHPKEPATTPSENAQEYKGISLRPRHKGTQDATGQFPSGKISIQLHSLPFSLLSKPLIGPHLRFRVPVLAFEVV